MRLEQALAGGLSGAVLVVTPQIADSTVVREVELPRLLDLETSSVFTLAVASVIDDPARHGRLDFDAPDRLLGLAPGTLRRLKQYRLADPADIETLAHQMALQRMAIHAHLGRDRLVIDIQTRAAPRATAVVDAGLVVRTEPPAAGRRAPPPGVWAPLRAFLAQLPKLVAESQASGVVVRGGAHLSVAFALGAALPTTAGRAVTVSDGAGDWHGDPAGPAVALTHETTTLRPTGPVAVAVDLVPGRPPIDTFAAHVDTAATAFAAVQRIASAHDQMVPPAACGSTVADLAGFIRHAAATHQTRRVALFLRVPFPIAVHLARMLNTLTVELYEWEDGVEPPIFLPTVTVASGRGGSPIVAITATHPV